ncbi:hypothetical protein, partial [Acidovorax sp. SUPP3334]|uniref:hypothetical protein n=1 Tax=Acidovorax sp. SUPP3334 TaxID=2920881 RepID=UPI0024E112B9
LGHLQNSQKTKSDLLILRGSSNQRNWRKPSVHAGCQGFAGATNYYPNAEYATSRETAWSSLPGAYCGALKSTPNANASDPGTHAERDAGGFPFGRATGRAILAP